MIMVNVGVRRGWSKFVRDPQKQPSWYYGGAIVWNAARLVKLEHFIDVKFIHQMSGFLLEVVVLTAMATLDLELISTFIIPIVVYTLICSSVTLMIAFGGCKLFCREEWFEKALMAYGVGTGNTATGLALVRAVDPDSQSSAPDNHGVYSAVMCWKEAFAGLVPVWMMTGLGMTMGVGAIMCAVCLGVGFVLFARPKKA